MGCFREKSCSSTRFKCKVLVILRGKEPNLNTRERVISQFTAFGDTAYRQNDELRAKDT